MIKLSDYLAKRLSEIYGVRHVFMVSGGGAMHINDSVGKYFDYVCCHNEQACSMAGEGYAKYNNQLAVVSVTTGPGGLNALNGLFGSWTDSVPVLFISGQVKYKTCKESCLDIPLRQLGDQEVDIISTVKHLCKYSVMVKNPNEIKYHLDKAVYEAIHNRFGPVWLDIPQDVQSAIIDENNLVEFEQPAKVKYNLKVDQVVENLQLAKRPLIVLGNGIRLANQQENFNHFIEKNKIPVVTTLNGFDLIDNRHSCYVGRIGTIGQRAGNFALQNADCILFLGTRNNIRQVSHNWENFGKNAFKIVVDIDQAELDKPLVRPDLKVNADLADFMPEIAKQNLNINCTDWLNWCVERKNKYDFAHTEEYQQKGNLINVYYFLHRLNQKLNKNDICVMANATPTVCTFQIAEIKQGQRLFSNSGCASMGYDLPASIGACFASGKKNTICLAGDGSIMMNLQELQTIKHHHLPIKIFVINNDGYFLIKQTQKNFFEGQYCGCGETSGVSLPDFEKVAQAFGIKAFKLECPEQVDESIDKMLSSDEPMLCEVVVNPDYILVPKLSAKKLDDGTMVSPSLEDMYPFLERDEFERNMIRENINRRDKL